MQILRVDGDKKQQKTPHSARVRPDSVRTEYRTLCIWRVFPAGDTGPALVWLSNPVVHLYLIGR